MREFRSTVSGSKAIFSTSAHLPSLIRRRFKSSPSPEAMPSSLKRALGASRLRYLEVGYRRVWVIL